jgi:hypothetical protein
MKKKTQRNRFRYFYINGKLHKLIAVYWGRDEALAWCYSEHTRRIYQWSDIRKRASRGFTPSQTAALLNRHPRYIHRMIYEGKVSPERIYSLTSGKLGKNIFSEEHIYAMQEVMANTHVGRPRKDGTIRPFKVPSKQELYAAMKHDLTLYAKNSDGEFVPLYAAEDW